MIIVDANLLIYSVNQDAVSHSQARTWLESTISGTETVGLPWSVLLAFLRLTTRPGIVRKPLSAALALNLVETWLTQPNVIAVEPTSKHFSVLRDLLSGTGCGGNLTSDAHLAAIAIEHGAELYSCDNDFGRFPRLRWRNPLA